MRRIGCCDPYLYFISALPLVIFRRSPFLLVVMFAISVRLHKTVINEADKSFLIGSLLKLKRELEVPEIMHSFVRIRKTGDSLSKVEVCDKACALCHGFWETTLPAMATSKFYVCAKCDAVVHSSCRSTAEKCIPCSSSLQTDSNGKKKDSESAMPRGHIYSRLLHAYDIMVPRQTVLVCLEIVESVSLRPF